MDKDMNTQQWNVRKAKQEKEPARREQSEVATPKDNDQGNTYQDTSLAEHMCSVLSPFSVSYTTSVRRKNCIHHGCYCTKLYQGRLDFSRYATSISSKLAST